jgi:hypothetical protein
MDCNEEYAMCDDYCDRTYPPIGAYAECEMECYAGKEACEGMEICLA